MRPWFINSKGEIFNSESDKGAKHLKRMEFGNAFHTREDALEARNKIKEYFSNYIHIAPTVELTIEDRIEKLGNRLAKLESWKSWEI